jgi:hypothetical protein
MSYLILFVSIIFVYFLIFYYFYLYDRENEY